MSNKLSAGRFAGRFRSNPIFPYFALRPNPTGLFFPFPFTARRRPKPRRLGGWQPPKIYGRFGSLEVRLARKKSEIRQAQRLRYKVFYEEMSAIPGALAMLSRRDEDAFDPVFDHLLVVDRGDPVNGRRWRRARVVGTYRVLRQDVADLYDGFYTQGEYDILPLHAPNRRAALAGHLDLCA
jgi:putative hemolysin